MWLRDFLSKDCKDCRTMIFGYNSKLRGRGIHSLRDYVRNFLEELRKARRSPEVFLRSYPRIRNIFELIKDDVQEQTRPIIFIGHSVGGVIIAQVSINLSGWS